MVNTVPGPVEELTAEMSYTNATLYWTKPSFNTNTVKHYEMEYFNLTDASCKMKVNAFNLPDYIFITTLNITEHIVSIPNLSTNTCYMFIVKAYSSTGAGKAVAITNKTLELITQKPHKSGKTTAATTTTMAATTATRMMITTTKTTTTDLSTPTIGNYVCDLCSSTGICLCCQYTDNNVLILAAGTVAGTTAIFVMVVVAVIATIGMVFKR